MNSGEDSYAETPLQLASAAGMYAVFLPLKFSYHDDILTLSPRLVCFRVVVEGSGPCVYSVLSGGAGMEFSMWAQGIVFRFPHALRLCAPQTSLALWRMSRALWGCFEICANSLTSKPLKGN